MTETWPASEPSIRIFQVQEDDRPVWTHLEGGSLKDLITSYQELMHYFDEFDHLMPSHNQPWLDKDLLPETLAGTERVLSGEAESRDVIDPWNRRLKQYSFGRFEILTPL